MHHTDKKKKKLAYLEKIKFVTKIMTYLEIQSNLQQVKLHNRFNESFEPISRFVHCVSMICYNVVSFWCAEYHKPSPWTNCSRTKRAKVVANWASYIEIPNGCLWKAKNCSRR